MKTLAIELPDDLDLSAGGSSDELAAVARMLFALHLLEQGKVTAAQAAKIAGLTWREFLVKAADRGVPAVNWDAEELAAERSVVAEGQ